MDAPIRNLCVALGHPHCSACRSADDSGEISRAKKREQDSSGTPSDQEWYIQAMPLWKMNLRVEVLQRGPYDLLHFALPID